MKPANFPGRRNERRKHSANQRQGRRTDEEMNRLVSLIVDVNTARGVRMKKRRDKHHA